MQQKKDVIRMGMAPYHGEIALGAILSLHELPARYDMNTSY
jgi:hypothetical protein